MIPGERMKGHEPHEMPLSEPVLKILERRKTHSKAPWVFPNIAKDETKKGPMERSRPSRACNRLSKDISIPSFGPHDLRRTIATRMAEMGAESGVIERCLGHKVGAGRAIIHYDHHNYRDRKREALDKWAYSLAQLISLTSSKNKLG